MLRFIAFWKTFCLLTDLTPELLLPVHSAVEVARDELCQGKTALQKEDLAGEGNDAEVPCILENVLSIDIFDTLIAIACSFCC